jgi:hypothetical protein
MVLICWLRERTITYRSQYAGDVRVKSGRDYGVVEIEVRKTAVRASRRSWHSFAALTSPTVPPTTPHRPPISKHISHFLLIFHVHIPPIFFSAAKPFSINQVFNLNPSRWLVKSTPSFNQAYSPVFRAKSWTKSTSSYGAPVVCANIFCSMPEMKACIFAGGNAVPSTKSTIRCRRMLKS